MYIPVLFSKDGNKIVKCPFSPLRCCCGELENAKREEYYLGDDDECEYFLGWLWWKGRASPGDIKMFAVCNYSNDIDSGDFLQKILDPPKWLDERTRISSDDDEREIEISYWLERSKLKQNFPDLYEQLEAIYYLDILRES